MLIGYFLKCFAITFSICQGEDYFFDQIKIRQDSPTRTGIILEEKLNNNSQEIEKSSTAKLTRKVKDRASDESLSEVIDELKNSSLNSSKADAISKMASEPDRTFDDQRYLINDESNKLKNVSLPRKDFEFSTLNSLIAKTFKGKTLSSDEKKHLAGILESMDENLSLNDTQFDSNYTSNVTNLDSPLNDTEKVENYQASYPDPDKVINHLSKELEELIKYHKAPYWEKMKDTILFPSFYHTQGTISLPYDGIVEPFEAWYAGKYHMSRIDYYYGMDKTFQRGDLLDYGVMVKVIPVHWGKGSNLDKNSISCWYRPGFRWAPQRGQSVIPQNLNDFKFLGEEIRSGMPTLKYLRTTTTSNKTDTYTLYITKEKPHRPLRYVMHGRDTLLHSAYDHYVIDYLTFHPWKFDFEVMKIPKGNYCEKLLSKHRSKLHFNPMAEFMHENFDDVDVEELYEHYKQKHGKNYPDTQEHEQRKNIFRHNMRYIRSHNRAGLNYTLESNELADLTDEEFEAYKGLLIDPSGGDEELKKQEIPEARFSIPQRPPPESLDWREYGAVTPAKAQGHCGSCWTFSAMGPIEGAYAIQTGKLVDFSEQQLLDCSWGFGNNGCRGGYSWRALAWAKKFGVTNSKIYGRYLAQEGYCHCAQKTNCTTVMFSRVMTVPKMNEKALRLGLAWYGPASIAVNADRKSFKFYSSGVLDDPKCAPRTNHGVVIVGYGEENGKEYWLIKNSWGKFWGDEGFIKIARKDNQCGILTNEPIFVKFDATSKLRGKDFPYLKMEKSSFIDMEKKMNVSELKLSPFDYKRSEIDFWTPPDFIRDKKSQET